MKRLLELPRRLVPVQFSCEAGFGYGFDQRFRRAFLARFDVSLSWPGMAM